MVENYKVVNADSSLELTEKVKESIHFGWQPFHAPSIILKSKTERIYIQAMVIYDSH